MGKAMRLGQAMTLALGLWCGAAAQADERPVQREGYRLQADVQGQGSVAVVFESGFGQGPGVWKQAIAELGADCTCIAYARAGLGASGSDGRPKSIEQHLQDLQAVMDALAPQRKVVLVGHSYGGLLASEFARRHPQRLLGVVLVDPATLGQRHAFKQADAARVQADDQALLAMLPPPLAADYRLLVEQLDRADAAAPRAPADVPLALMTSTQVAADPFVLEETAQGKAIWKRQHAELFAGFVRGSHRYYATGHNLHREDPKAVADAVRSVAAMAAAP